VLHLAHMHSGTREVVGRVAEVGEARGD
jgi:hypothetical protein